MHKLNEFISPLIASQFPQIYREEGPAFVAFVKAYYEWLETQGPLHDSRRLLSYRDIDTTLPKFIDNFLLKYMDGLPVDAIGDKRQLQKHITEVFASKGSPRGLELLLRLVYNVESSVYFPGDDILRASDGTWVIPTYLEVQDQPYNYLLVGEDVTGAASGARAVVESYERRTVQGRLVNVMYLSNIRGTFQLGETLLSPLIDPIYSPVILGPLTSITIETSALDYAPGDVLDVLGSRGTGGQVVVTETGVRAGTVSFKLITGGSGYTAQYANAVVTGNDGAGADFNVTVGNTTPFITSTVTIAAYANVMLDAADYGMSGTGVVNAASVIEDGLDPFVIDVGTITGLVRINPGQGYTGNIQVQVIDELISGYGFANGSGGTQGLDAVVTGKAQFGSGVIEAVKVINAGVGYRHGDEVTLTSNLRPEVATGFVVTAGQGSGEGYWSTTRGFLNSDKYLHDSYYYQEYSYVVRTSMSLDRYADLLRRIWHPAGVEMFGAVVFISTADSTATPTECVVTSFPNTNTVVED